MALAYFDWGWSLTPPDNEQQQEFFSKQAIIRLIAGKIDSDSATELLASITETGSIGLGVFAHLIRVYQEMGNHAAAERLAGAIIGKARLWVHEFPHANVRLEYARALAAAGHSEEALEELETLVESGWRAQYWQFLRFYLYFDVTLDGIRDHPRFQALVATIEADMAQQLENVREMQRRGEVPTLEDVNALIASTQESN